MEANEAQNSIDIKENYIMCLDKRLLGVLLKDKSSGDNIIWATDMYDWRGSEFHPREPITIQAITGRRGNVIKPRIEKSKREQKERIRKKAEVFTPSWICNLMASGFDSWFNAENVFNTPDGLTWKKSEGKIIFPERKSWKEYVRLRILEITCGEAPFLASRYDTVTGEWIDVNSRVGLLDRKLRVVNENTESEADWIKYAFEAYQSTYGFEWQGDSLLIARENLLFTFIDYYNDRFSKLPEKDILLQLATILSWNIFQMDGLKYVVPYSCEPKTEGQMNLFDELPQTSCCGCETGDNGKHIGIYSKIKNWRSKTVYDFYSLSGVKSMKFDFIIGNPPYQDSTSVNNRAGAVYNYFYDISEELSDRYCLISPARFLFNTGLTPKEWNKKMLANPHLKVVLFEQDATKIFPQTDIKGGIAILYYDKKENFGAIKEFVPNDNLKGIVSHFQKDIKHNLSSIIYGGRSDLKFTNEFLKAFPQSIQDRLTAINAHHSNVTRLSPNEEYELKSSTFDVLPYAFETEEPSKFEDYYKLVGLVSGNRCYRWILKKYMTPRYPLDNNINYYKVLIPESNGSGTLGETLSSPFVMGPQESSTPTFISIGKFKTKIEADNALNYVKTKFVRLLLGILKKTQHNAAPVWAYIPLQDFTENSDIDWQQSVAEIDVQLYKKYGLSNEEIAFIETHVKEMI